MSKKPVSYIKPQDPSFLVKLKKEAGYVEGPTVDTKKQTSRFDSDSEEEAKEELPVVVVLKDGDLTAEEADLIVKQQESEKANAKADLSQRVIFQQPTSSKRPVKEVTKKESSKKAKHDNKKSKQLLSFDDEDD